MTDNVKTYSRFIKGVLTNIIAGLSPRLFIYLTSETGRGQNETQTDHLVNYCTEVVNDYGRMMNKAGIDLFNWIKNKSVLEYGPGDFLGVPLILLAEGASHIYCLDRFPLKVDEKYDHVYQSIADHSFTSSNSVTWLDVLNSGVTYMAVKNGVAQLPEKVDLIISRAVLEHCNNLSETFENMSLNLKPGGFMIHKVDLTSHSEHYNNDFEFLYYSKFEWTAMTCFKGYPNRYRRNEYLNLIQKYGFDLIHSESEFEFSEKDLMSAKDEICRDFRMLEREDLLCSDFFFIARNPG